MPTPTVTTVTTHLSDQAAYASEEQAAGDQEIIALLAAELLAARALPPQSVYLLIELA